MRALLTLGRLPKALDVARALAARGVEVQVAEPHQRHLTGASSAVQKIHRTPSPTEDRDGYGEALLELVDREAIDLLVPISEESLFVVDLAARLPERTRLFAGAAVTVHALHDKAAFAASCHRLGLPVPQTAIADLPTAATLAAMGPTIIKPRFSCAGAGVERRLKGAPLHPRDRNPLWLVQQAIDGPLLCSFSIAHEGQVLATVLYRALMLSGSVAVCFERFTPATVPEAAHLTGWRAGQDAAALCTSAEASIEALVADSGYSGFIAFDFIADAQHRAVAIECNPRATSGIHFLSEQALGQMLLAPGERPTEPLLRPQRRLQQFYPSLTETQNALWARPGKRQPGAAGTHLKHLFRCRDVTFRLRDPLPFLLMPYWAWPIMAPALFEGRSFGEAATADIDWQPPESEAGNPPGLATEAATSA